MSYSSPRRHGRSQRSSCPSAQLEQLESRRLLSADPASLRDAGFVPIDWQGKETYVRPGEWIVQIDGLSGARGKQLKAANALLAGTGISAREQLGADGLLLVEAAPAAGFDRLRTALQRVPGFEYIEPNVAFSIEQTPNDTDFSKLWGLHNTNDADIDAPEAWDLSTGGTSSVVAVIDTGVDYNHPDLKANMWVNAGEQGVDADGKDKATNGKDDDDSGYIDDVHGANFIVAQTDPASGNPMDDQGHGTHVAGTIGGVGNNGAGVAGVNWNAQLMALKFLAADGYGTSADAIEALYYTINLKKRAENPVNVNVTNNSYGGEPWSRAFYEAIKDTGAAGQLFIAAAGNGDWLGRAINNDTSAHYPSSYGHDGRTFDDPATTTIESLPSLDNVIAVTATDSNDAKASWANYGAKSVDLGAPGVNIWSAAIGGGYKYNSGTSMAAPHVAGAAALAWSYNPGASVAQVKAAIIGGVDPITSLATNTITGGRLNAFKTLQGLPPSTPPSAPQQLTATGLSSNRISLAWKDSSGEAGYKIERSLTGQGGWEVVGSTIANQTTFTDTGLSGGTTYYYKVQAHNAAGSTYSAPASAKTSSPIVPENPTGLTATAFGATEIRLAWTDNSAGETRFEIQRSDGASVVTIPVSKDTVAYSDEGLKPSTTYTYVVSAVNDAGRSDSNSASAMTAGTGTGLRGDYYDNMLTEDRKVASAYTLSGWKFARTDATVNAVWGNGAPSHNGTTLGADSFTIKWTGSVQPRYTDNYTFRFEPDDGVGMWITIDGVKQQLWTPTWDRYDGTRNDRTSTEYANTTPYESAPLALKAGEKYPIEIVYYEYSGGAQAKLLWRSANHQALEVVPQSQLYYAPDALSATTVSDTQVKLTWVDHSGDKAGFKVERSTNGSTWTQIGTTSGDSAGGTGSYVASGLTPGTAYSFRVRAYTSSPAFNSNYSNTAVATVSATATAAAQTSAASLFSTEPIDASLLDELEAALT